MILTVTCNPALDITYTVDRLRPGAVHRVSEAFVRPGGKGVNVSRVLHQLGEPVRALGLADAGFGARLAELGVPASFEEAVPEVRRTIVVKDAETTSLWERGHPVAPGAVDRLVGTLEEHLGEARALVVSGSLPPGVAADLPVRLARLAAEASVPVVLDLDDEPLAAAVRGGGAVLTPNTDELARLLGAADDPVASVRALAARTGAPVVHTLGERGLLATDGTSVWRASLPRPIAGNPTGAGDAVTACIARGLALSHAWPDILRDAVALGAAAVAVPTAGEVDLAAYDSHLAEALVEVVDPARAER
ncbi:MAG TPA: hexose kinase [Nocardioides sp.]|nr:hexose kinase [Nocardioides sp.]